MKKFCCVNPYVEDVLLWAGPNVKGSFSYLNPFGSRLTLRHWRGEWGFVAAETQLQIVENYLDSLN